MIQKLKCHDPYVRPNQNVETQTELVGDEIFEVRKLSLRTKRRIVTLALTAFTIGALLIVINSPARNSFLAPGPLISTHAQILAEQGADRCAACHDQGNESLGAWMAGSVSNGEPSKCQSTLCMDCHKNSINSNFALDPHNVDPNRLVVDNSKLSQSGFITRVALGSPVNKNQQLACSTCHKEHHGSNDLTKLTDQQCQACHSNVYHSFESDHPEFTNWPIADFY